MFTNERLFPIQAFTITRVHGINLRAPDAYLVETYLIATVLIIS